MQIIKFGGKSLANGKGIEQALSIIEDKVKGRGNRKIATIIVLSARGNTTNQLIELLQKAQQGLDYSADLESLKRYQKDPFEEVDLQTEFKLIENTLEGVKLLQDYSLKVKDLLVAQGELMSTKTISAILNSRGITSRAIDSRQFLTTDSQFGDTQVQDKISEAKTIVFFKQAPLNYLPIVTGFIAANEVGVTTTLGRNGSNYSTALLAKYLEADEVLSYTHVNGIHTANPDQVKDARIIDKLNYQEANELASFGASILHARSIIPLMERNIPLRILNTFSPEGQGTYISQYTNNRTIKSVAVQQSVCMINIAGKGLLGKVGVDARIFGALHVHNINIGVISQGSSERSVGFVIDQKDADKAIQVLEAEFSEEIKNRDVNTIDAIENIAVITVIGQNIKGFSTAYQALINNDIDILLLNNTIHGNNISVVVAEKDLHKAVNSIHSQIFGVAKNINIAIFGKGTVGGTLLTQILNSKDQIQQRKEIKLNVFAIVGTQKVLLTKNGINEDWKTAYENATENKNGIQQVIAFAKANHFENLIAIDNTASTDFVKDYTTLVENGFDLISSNKIANTQSYASYQDLRTTLKQYRKQYLYETNVGAGLPLIDTIKLLHDSGENITRIRGVFSGSLSYIFNHFSVLNQPFSEILNEAIEQGFTEPDPREDLCGNDVARKLLILARELDLENEFSEIKIKNLIPEGLRGGATADFLTRLEELNPYYDAIKADQEENHVLRYVGDLHGDLEQNKGILEVDLVSVPKKSSLGQVKGSDSIFEIYTKSYGDNPIVIQGAGAGAEVTARGVFGDLLRIAEKK